MPKKKPVGGISLFGAGGIDITKALKKSTDAKSSNMKIVQDDSSNIVNEQDGSEAVLKSSDTMEAKKSVLEDLKETSDNKNADELMSSSSDSNELFGTTIPPMPDEIGSQNRMKDPLFGSPGESNSRDEDSSDDLFAIK